MVNSQKGASERLRMVISDKNMTIQGFSDALGFPKGTIEKYLNSPRLPNAEFLSAIYAKMGVSANWLLDGVGTYKLSNGSIDGENNDFVQIKRYSVSASAGQGAENDSELGTGWYAFNQKWLDRRNLSANNLSVIQVRGDSMEPKFSDNDLVLLDHSQNEAKDGFIYTIRVGNELYVKSIQTVGEEVVYMVSANRDYPPQKITPNEDAQIIGRVVASMHEW